MFHWLCNPLKVFIRLPSLASTYTTLDPLYIPISPVPSVDIDTDTDINNTPIDPSVTLPSVYWERENNNNNNNMWLLLLFLLLFIV